MIVISLFDGISCARVALKRANIKIEKYYASEIKKSAIKVSQDNHDDIIQIGDVTKIHFKDGVLYTEMGIYQIGHSDVLLLGGSPCQDFSIAKVNGLGLKGDKSKLFYEFLRLKNELNPKYFLLENVKMKKINEEELNDYLDVKGVHINSRLVSFQNRPRVYWTNIVDLKEPKDKNISFQDYRDTDYDYCKIFKVNKTPSRERMWYNGEGKNGAFTGCYNVTSSDKVQCLTRSQDRSPNSGLVEFEDFCRFLTKRELELAQTLPIDYTKCLSYRQACDVLGDAWTVDVIVHIFQGMKK